MKTAVTERKIEITNGSYIYMDKALEQIQKQPRIQKNKKSLFESNNDQIQTNKFRTNPRVIKI